MKNLDRFSDGFLMINESPDKAHWEEGRVRFRHIESEAWEVVQEFLGKPLSGTSEGLGSKTHKPFILERELERVYLADAYGACLILALSIIDYWINEKNSGLSANQKDLISSLTHETLIKSSRNGLVHLHNSEDQVVRLANDRKALCLEAEALIKVAIALNILACAR